LSAKRIDPIFEELLAQVKKEDEKYNVKNTTENNQRLTALYAKKEP